MNYSIYVIIQRIFESMKPDTHTQTNTQLQADTQLGSSIN